MTTNTTSPIINYALMAPVCALEPFAKDGMVHAVTMDGVVAAMAGKPLYSACGADVKLLSIPIGNDEPIPWPISTRGLPKQMHRCHACWYETGRKRPRARLVPKEQVSSAIPQYCSSEQERK